MSDILCHKTKNEMKRIILIFSMALFLLSGSYASSPFLTEKTEEKQEEVLLEKKTKFDESNIWKSDEIITKDDDKILNAPPPGDENKGNPQKIVTPLGDGVFQLLFLLGLSGGYLLVRKSSLRFIARNKKK